MYQTISCDIIHYLREKSRFTTLQFNQDVHPSNSESLIYRGGVIGDKCQSLDRFSIKMFTVFHHFAQKFDQRIENSSYYPKPALDNGLKERTISPV